MNAVRQVPIYLTRDEIDQLLSVALKDSEIFARLQRCRMDFDTTTGREQVQS